MAVLYIYIYSPALQFMPFGLDKIIFIISFLYIVIFGQLRGLVKSFKNEFIYLFLIMLSSLFVTIIHRGFGFDGILMYDLFLFFEVILVPYVFFVLFVKKWNVRSDKLLIDNAIIASMVTVLLLANPLWAEMMKNQILRVPEILLINFRFRGFGFSDGLTFGYPVVQGFCASFIVAGMIKHRPFYIYLALFSILVSVLVNARSGLIPIFIALILVIWKSSIKNKMKIFVVGIMLFLLGYFILTESEDSQLAESVEWGLSTFEIIGNMLSGEEAENMDALFYDMVQFPTNFNDWLLGTGYNLFDGYINGYNQSDIGFCIRTVYGGAFYMFLWFCLWIFMYKRSRKINKMFAIIMFSSLIYLNWKSDFFIVNPSCRFFFLVYVFCILDNNFLTDKKLA